MAQKPTMLTLESHKKLEEELSELINVKRKEIAEKIKVARSFGDLSENSEYDDAKNEQAILEARITTIEAILKTAVLIDELHDGHGAHEEEQGGGGGTEVMLDRGADHRGFHGINGIRQIGLGRNHEEGPCGHEHQQGNSGLVDLGNAFDSYAEIADTENDDDSD